MVIKVAQGHERRRVRALEQLPNIGPSLAADLRLIGIEHPADLRGKDACALYRALCDADRPAPGPVRARHLHGRHRLHARRRRRAVVEVHRRAQGDLRRDLSRRARRRGRTGRSRDRAFRAFVTRGRLEQSVRSALAGAAVADSMPRSPSLKRLLTQLTLPSRRAADGSRARARSSLAAAGAGRRERLARLGRGGVGERSRSRGARRGPARLRRGARRHPHRRRR